MNLGLKSKTILDSLPIKNVIPNVLNSLDNTNDILIISAETGSGKSIGIGLEVAKHGYKVLINIPTIPATISLYNFALENSTTPEHIGYACYGEVHYVDNTLLRYVTTKHGFNVLKKACSKVQRLPKNYVFVLDEAHHTTSENLATFLLALYAMKKKILKKFVVMSATIEDMDFQDFNVQRIDAPGRMFFIKTFWNDTNIDIINIKEFIKCVCQKILTVLQEYPGKGILVFLTGENEVDLVSENIESQVDENEISVRRLYSKLPYDEMVWALEPCLDKTKVVISTNIGESSLTIEGISIVIDSCTHKLPYSNNGYGIKLVKEFIPKNKAIQRRGRSGRTEEGYYFPLITEEKFNSLQDKDLSDLVRIVPYGIVLELLDSKLPAQEILNIPNEKYDEIIKKLLFLELVDSKMRTTDLGKNVHHYPFSLENSIIMYKATIATLDDGNTCDELLFFTVAILISMIEGSQGGSFFWVPKLYRSDINSKLSFLDDHFEHLKGDNDLITYINIFDAMIYGPKTLRDRDVNKWCSKNYFNNKMLKSVRMHFNNIVRDFYSHKYSTNALLEVLATHSIDSIRELGNLSNMKKVYPLFVSAYSTQKFSNGKIVGKKLSFANEQMGRYMIDSIRSYSYISARCSEIIAIQLITTVIGNKSSNYMSCVFPVDPENFVLCGESAFNPYMLGLCSDSDSDNNEPEIENIDL